LRYLVDSDWVVDALANLPNALATLEQLASDGLAISIISLGEVLEGAYGASNPDERVRQVHQFLSGWVILGLDQGVIDVFAKERLRLRRQGNLIPDFDLLIGATAVHHGLTLLTRNQRHFGRVANLKLYQS
jgi:tRNA(fMet)-specific endonuclease VapC